MSTRFPGMDPYLERPDLWQEVHTGLIVGIQQYLTPRVQPQYRVAIEQRTYLAVLPFDELELVGQPDVLVVDTGGAESPHAAGLRAAQPVVAELPMPEEVTERYLEIRDVATGEVVTVIEILSPTNKLPHRGREKYLEKRLRVLSSLSNLVEIDLLRVGEPLPMNLRRPGTDSDYRIIVSRARKRPYADAYLFSVRDPIPVFAIPLRPQDPEPTLPLNQILHDLYARSRYDLAIDYTLPPQPPLHESDADWAAALLTAEA